RKDKNHGAELRSLGLMHGHGIGEFEIGTALFRKIAGSEAETFSLLRGELDLRPVELTFPSIAIDDTNLAVCKISGALAIIPVPALARMVAQTHDFVAVGDLVRTTGRDYLPPSAATLCGSQPFGAYCLLDQPIDLGRTARHVPMRREDLPSFCFIPASFVKVYEIAAFGAAERQLDLPFQIITRTQFHRQDVDDRFAQI